MPRPKRNAVRRSVCFRAHFGRVIAGWRADLIRAAALIEATIDFADEDVPTDVYPEVTALIQGVLAG
jgi:tRNA modification GTPase